MLLLVLLFNVLPYLLWLALAVGSVLVLLGMMLGVLVLFVFKLTIVYRNNDQQTEHLMKAITKSTILTTLSISMTFINMIQAYVRLLFPFNIAIWIFAVVPFLGFVHFIFVRYYVFRCVQYVL
eukprot:UN01672